jgi:hypothetical protein
MIIMAKQMDRKHKQFKNAKRKWENEVMLELNKFSKANVLFGDMSKPFCDKVDEIPWNLKF